MSDQNAEFHESPFDPNSGEELIKRRQVARQIHEWLTGHFQDQEKDKTGKTIGEKAQILTTALEHQHIFFALRDPQTLPIPLKFSLKSINFPPQSAAGGTEFRFRGKLLILEASEAITTPESLTEVGSEAIDGMYETFTSAPKVIHEEIKEYIDEVVGKFAGPPFFKPIEEDVGLVVPQPKLHLNDPALGYFPDVR